MLHKIRERAQSEKGFTLIELLVVILIIGILAAIALPAFLNQREKAQDSEAKSAVRTAQTAMETFYTDNQTYVGATQAALQAIEPTLIDAAATVANGGNNLVIAPNGTVGYKLTTTSKGSNANTFSVELVSGDATRTCTAPGKGGCKAANPAGNMW